MRKIEFLTLPVEVIEKRLTLIYELLENVPVNQYVTITSIMEYFEANNEPMKQSSLLSFITHYCIDVYEGEGPGFYYFGLTEDHVFAAEPVAEKLIVLMDYYRAGMKKRRKKTV